MHKADQPSVGGIVTGSGKSRRAPLLRMARLALAVLIVAGLAAGGFVAYRLKLAPMGSNGSATATKRGDMAPAQALKAAQTELRTASTPTEKATAYIDLGDAYRSGGQVTQSSSAYQQALTYAPDDIPLLERLSGAYEDAGDTANAVKTLQKLIDAINATNPSDKDWLLSRYQAELKYDQGGH